MAKYLDQTGLTYFWGKIKGFVNSHEHPVGSVYITISSSFNPANHWGGTWSKIAEGQCLIQAGNTYALGSTGGESEHTLTIHEMPYHNHNILKPRWGATSEGANAVWGSNGSGDGEGYDGRGYQGDGVAHNNMQPYLAVNIWKRTA